MAVYSCGQYVQLKLSSLLLPTSQKLKKTKNI